MASRCFNKVWLTLKEEGERKNKMLKQVKKKKKISRNVLNLKYLESFFTVNVIFSSLFFFSSKPEMNLEEREKI